MLKRKVLDVQKSKDCPYKFATKLPVPSGNATWKVPEKIPDSTVFIRVWLWAPQPDGTFKQVNYGRTKGYFQVCSSSLLEFTAWISGKHAMLTSGTA